jgi:riboflavin biosynthesis pyrimidine reductase
VREFSSVASFAKRSFLQAGVVDELSLVLAPLADGESDSVTLKKNRAICRSTRLDGATR